MRGWRKLIFAFEMEVEKSLFFLNLFSRKLGFDKGRVTRPATETFYRRYSVFSSPGSFSRERYEYCTNRALENLLLF